MYRHMRIYVCTYGNIRAFCCACAYIYVMCCLCPRALCCFAVSLDTPMCVAVCCSVLQCVAACCSVLLCIAVCCRSTVLRVSVCCVPEHADVLLVSLLCTGQVRRCAQVVVYCSVLQYVAACCSVLQCVPFMYQPGTSACSGTQQATHDI